MNTCQEGSLIDDGVRAEGKKQSPGRRFHRLENLSGEWADNLAYLLSFFYNHIVLDFGEE